MKLRGLIVLMTTFFMGFVFIGSMRSLGVVIRYPVRTIMTVSAYTGKDKTATISAINKLAKQSNIVIYKEFITGSGATGTAKLGKEQVNIKELKNYSLTGVYYLSNNNSKFDQEISADSSLTVNILNTLLLFFPQFALMRSSSASSVWILFFIFFVSIYAIEMTSIKSAMIYRSLGRLSRYVWRNFLYYVTIILFSETIVFLFFLILQGSIENALVQGFFLTLVISLVLLILLAFLANTLYLAVVKLNDISSILNRRYINRLGSLIYLAGIISTIIVFSYSANISVRTALQLSNYQQTLSKWQSVKDYVIPGFIDGSESHTNAGLIDHDWLVNQTQKEIAFNQSFSDQDFIFSQPSAFNSNMEKSYKTLIGQTKAGIVNIVKTNSNLTPQTLYVSKGFILLNQHLYPKNIFGEINSEKLVTLYVPQSLKREVQTIENNVIAENFAVFLQKIDVNQFQVNIIPDQQESFLLNFNQNISTGSILGNQLPQQTQKNKILVQLNYQKINEMASSENVLRLLRGNTVPYGRALIRQNVLVQKLKEQGLYDQMTSIDKVTADANLLAQTVNRQLQGSWLAIFSVILSSLFILWEYLKNQYQRAAKSIVVHYLFSGDSRKQEFYLLLPLLFGITVAAIVSGVITESMAVFGGVWGLYLFEVLAVVLINQKVLKQKRVQIIKDSLE